MVSLSLKSCSLAHADILPSISQVTANPAAQQQLQTQWDKVESNNAADSQATNAGNTQSINFNSPENSKVHYSGSQTVKNVPNVSASPITTSNDTCMGSATGGVAVAGVGLTIGKTYTDENCIMLKNSREMWNMGMHAAGLALMCTDANNRYALEATGYKCPDVTKADVEAERAKRKAGKAGAK